jgi:hypothetical protein
MTEIPIRSDFDLQDRSFGHAIDDNRILGGLKGECWRCQGIYILIEFKAEFKAELIEFFCCEGLVEVIKEILFVD